MNPKRIICSAFGETLNVGPHHCCYCGGPCDDTLPAAITDGWTDYGSLSSPASPYRCRGCDLSFREEASFQFVDGTTPEAGKRMVSAVRMQSWILTPNLAVAYGMRHRAQLRHTLCGPLPLEYVACVTTGGQKHFLWQTPAGSGDDLTCSIDGKVVVAPLGGLTARLQQQKKGLMQKLLTGKVRVVT